MKKRILSFILAICMVFTLMPHFVFAEGSTSATPSVSAYATKAQLMDDTFSPDLNGKATNIGKLAFGKKDDGAVQDWYILGGGDGEEYTILFAASSMTSWLPFANQSQDLDYKAEWECTYLNPVTTVHSNHYGGSNLRFELQDRLSNFTATEVNMINDTDLSIRDMKNTNSGGYYTITDKLYAVSCLNNKLMAGGVSDTIKFLARDPYWKTGYAFWLRTPCTESGCTEQYAYSVDTESGTFATHFTILEFSTARPAANLNLSSALFASAAQAASSDTATAGTIGKDSNGEPQAMTLRLDGSSKNIGTVTYNTTKGDIKATKGSTSGNVALVVQGNDGTNDWYYSKKITGTETVNVSAVKSALGLSSDIDLSACKVWLETTEDNVAYAVTATGCSTEAELKAAIDAGESAITLTADISLSDTLTLSDKIFTLDLAGRTITGNITLSDSSAEPQTIMTLIDSDPAAGGVVKGNITLTKGNGSASHLYANGGTVTGQTSLPSYAGGIFCTSDTPTAFKGYVGNYGEIHGGMFYSNIKESCIKEKTITFMNDGSRYALQVLPSGNKATVPIALKKDGYTFLGWYNGDTKYDFTQAVTENITLTAKWVLTNISTEDELRSSIGGGATSIKLVSDIKLSSALDLSKKNITIDLNGYVISGADISINTGNGKASLTLKDSRPTANHSDSTLPKGGVVTSKISMKQDGGGYNDCVLYANGGTVTSEFDTNTNAVAIKCTSNTPTAFTGKISGYAHLYGGIYYGTINSTVKVERKKITFQIGGKTYAYEVVDSDSGYKTVAPISPDATKYGYQTFDGWYNGSTKYTFGSALSENITLTAKFSNLISYNITYNLNGGTATNPTSYTVESDAITLTNPTKNGYNFTGWSGTGLVGEANMTVTVPKGSMGNRVYTAHYQDITAPTGEISIGTNKWTEFFNNVTFGLFFKDTQNVTVTASDNSGDNVTITYLLSDKELTVDELNASVFTAYTGAFYIEPNNEYVIYAKLTDSSGNICYINSNGVVLDNVDPLISGIIDGKTYCEAQTVTIDEKYVDSVTMDGTAVTLTNGKFTLSPADGKQTIVVTDKAGNKAEMTVTVNDGHTAGNDDGDCSTPVYCIYHPDTVVVAAKSHDWSGKDGICTVCGATCTHTGGTATCTTQAVCDICNASYGDLADHTGGTATCTTQAVCENCGVSYGDLADHTGGTATCTTQAVCTICGASYGDLADHTGGTATCQTQAVCEVCEASYGELDPNNHEYEKNNGICCDTYQPAELNESGYYAISNAGQLFWIANYVNNVSNEINVLLTTDITIPEGKEWTPIMNFYGTFDGGYYTVSGLDASGDEFVGMFGGGSYAYGTIKNLHITNSRFEGTSYVGALAGYHAGNIYNCYVDSSVTVTGDSSTGLLVGHNAGAVQNCYAYGSSCVGYYDGNYSTVENCYYLSETETEDGGKTAEQFASGEVAYLLQQGNTEQVWGQDNNQAGATPIFDATGLYKVVTVGETGNYSVANVGDTNGDGTVDVIDYQALVNKALADDHEQIETASYDDIVKYDLDGDGYLDVVDAYLLHLFINGFTTVDVYAVGDYDLNGVAFEETDIKAIKHAIENPEKLATYKKYASDINGDGKLDENDLTALTAKYGEVTDTECADNVEVYYRWGNKYSTCTATAMCTLCGEKIATETVNTTSETLAELTCTQDGKVKYTATFQNELFGTKTIEIVLKTEGHKYNDNGFCLTCDVYQPAELNESGYYEIGNAGQLFWFANYINTVDRTANAVLTADIDLENRPWTPIGETNEAKNNFRGIFDGQNYTIRGLNVEGSENGVGFFGEVRTGTVKNFTIYGEVVVNAEIDYVGGVIGSICGLDSENDLERNGAVIQNITSYVNVTANAHGIGMIGGFVGYADHQSLIEQCAWYGTFDAGEYRVDSGAGGFIGKIQENTSEVTIRNCGAYGTIKTNYAGDYNNTATIYMGGFLSFSNTGAQTTLENCLFAGKFECGENLTDEARLGAFGTLRSVNAIKNCYYLGDDGLEAVHSDSNLKPGSDNVEITKVTEDDLRNNTIATQLGGYWEQGEDYPVIKK